jgi:hypothetical protein
MNKPIKRNATPTSNPKTPETGGRPGARERQPGMGKKILIYIHVHEELERNPKEG